MTDPVLRRIAQIVDGTNVVQEITLDPSASGLDLVCRGLWLISDRERIAMEGGALIYAQLTTEPR